MNTGNDVVAEVEALGRFDLDGRIVFGVAHGHELEIVADEDGHEWNALARLATGAARPARERVPLAKARLLAPLGPSQRVLAVALNYPTHVGETRNAPPESPIIFYKPPSAFVAPGGTLAPPPGYTAQFDYEGEIGVVIGKRCRQVAEADALDCVFGITAVMDGTGRDRLRVKAGDKVFLDWLGAKAADNASMLGPYLCYGPGIRKALRKRTIGIRTLLNDEVVQDGSLSELIFSVEQIIAFLTRFITLLPGDVLAIGTPGGIGVARGRLLQSGDRLEVQASLVPALQGTVG